MLRLIVILLFFYKSSSLSPDSIQILKARGQGPKDLDSESHTLLNVNTT